MDERDTAGVDGRHTAGMSGDPVLAWLLDGDVAVAYQATRDLLGRDDPALQARIATEGHGASLLAAQGPEGHWGRGFYEPKWTCSHYTLLELKNLGLHPTPRPRHAVARILAGGTGPDGGLNPSGTVRASDVCISGMALGCAACFGADTALPTHPELTRLHHPSRWYCEVLRGMDALRDAGVGRDPRMGDALDLLRPRRRPDGRWVVNRAYPGATHVPAPREAHLSARCCRGWRATACAVAGRRHRTVTCRPRPRR